MRNSNSNNQTKAVSLVAAIAIMVIMATLGVVMVSMLGTTSRGVVDYHRSSQAFAIAQGGLNWYMMQLVGISDWTTAGNQTNISLGSGTFDVTLSNMTSTRMDIAVTGRVAGTAGVNIQRTMSQRVLKLPSAAKFAFYWGRSPTSSTTLTLIYAAVNGDIWSIGNLRAFVSSFNNGTLYYPTRKTVPARWPRQAISAPIPVMPAITSTYYTTLISGYNTAITTSPGSFDLIQSSGTFNVSGTTRYRNVSLTGTVTITGNGTLIANGTTTYGIMTLGSTSGGRVIIRPDAGGSITFLARRNLTVNNVTIDNINNPVPDYYQRVRMYSQAIYGTSDRMTIQNTANLDRVFLLSNRRILVQRSTTSPTVTNSTLFVNYNSTSATNNNLTVTGNGTTVGTVASPCSLISIGRGSPSLQITTTARVVGLVYQRNPNNLGYTRILGSSSGNRVNIRGSLVASQFTSNMIGYANITYDLTAIPDPPPEGFNGFTTKKPNSWSGN